MALWEFWIGRFIINTPLIKLFYFLMGAQIHRTVSVDAFIRESDLVKIQRGTLLQFQVHCRRFGSWKENYTLTMIFCPTSIGCDCVVKGMISLGTFVGANAFVDDLSVVQEGAQVPKATNVVGNPVFVSDTFPNVGISPSQTLCILGILKIMWIYNYLLHKGFILISLT